MNRVKLILITGLILCMSFSCNKESTAGRSLQNIETFARLYGYVRYFHPSDQASAIDWNRFLIYGIRQVECAHSSSRLKQVLKRLFQPIAPSVIIFPSSEKRAFSLATITPEDKSAYKVVSWQHFGVGLEGKPDKYRSVRLNRQSRYSDKDGRLQLYARALEPGTHVVKPLGSGLSCIIPLALYATPSYTFPAVDTQLFTRLVSALKSNVSENPGATNPYVRYAGVVIAWNIFQHFSPNFDPNGQPGHRTNWGRVLTQTLIDAGNDRTEAEFLHTLKTMLSHLHDGHAQVYHPLVKKRAGLPFRVEWIEDNPVIVVSNDPQFKRGDIVVSIDGVNARQLQYRTELSASGSPQLRRQRALETFSFGPRGSIVEIFIYRNGEVLYMEAARNSNARIREFVRPAIKQYKGKIYYIDLRNLQMEEFQRRTAELAKANGLIFDVRDNVGFDKRMVLTYLTHQDITSPIWHVPESLYPDHHKVIFQDRFWKLNPSEPQLTAKKVFLVNAGTLSAAETFIEIVKHFNIGKIVGRVTAGANGNINWFTLPSKYKVIFNGMRAIKHDTTRFHLNGIKPDIPVQRTIDAVKDGKDEVLEKAIEILRN